MRRLLSNAVGFGLLGSVVIIGCSDDSGVEQQNANVVAAGSAGAPTTGSNAGAAGGGAPAVVPPVVTAGAGAGGQPPVVVPAAGSGGQGVPPAAGAGGASEAVAGAGGGANEPVNGIPADYEGTPWQGTAQEIPGVLEFEFWDEGGPDVAYTEATPDTQEGWQLNACNDDSETCTLAKFRMDEQVETSFTKGLDINAMINKLYVGWTAGGEWLKYTINVKESGTYVAKLWLGVNPEAQPTTVSFDFDDVAGEPITLDSTGSFHTWGEFDALFEVELEAGMHLMTLNILTTGRTNFDWIEFTKKP